MAAMAKPLVVARRGVLPQIVEDGRTGLVVDDTAAKLASAILKMAEDKAGRQRWGEAARERMVRFFSPGRQAAEVEDVYRRALEQHKTCSLKALRQQRRR